MLNNSNKYTNRILRLKDVTAISGMSPATIYRKEKAGLFPLRVSLGGGTVGWIETEINQWFEELISARNHQ